MNGLDQVNISDCTLLESGRHFELSFREKIELCRKIDRLGVSTINVSRITNPKIDRLLIKSICSAVENACVAVPVDLKDPESVELAWDSVKDAAQSRLQVPCPVSSVQMEYLLHLKPKAAIQAVRDAVAGCRGKTEHVELIAEDATRSDPGFLKSVICAAVDAGATVITLCDTAGIMMPEEISEWLVCLQENVPELSKVTIGFYSSGELNMADACAISAIRAGAREIKAIACTGNAISLPNIVRILQVKGAANGVATSVRCEQLRRITAQVENICRASDRKNQVFEPDSEAHEQEIYLSVHDSIETVIHASELLGYDLSQEDQQKVWNSFIQTAEKKESITLKELDAIIAAEAMQVPPAYSDIRYVINTGNQFGALAQMKLKFHNQELSGIASGDGAIDAAFNSIEQATGRHFELEEFQIQSVTEGREAMGETIVKLRSEGRLYSGRGISTDIVGAGIMAYINAVNKIVYEEEDA